jgi:predicted transcriptional regulator
METKKRAARPRGIKGENRGGGGGKLARSETVTVRLDPKLRYLADIAARKQRRTLSSFIEWAVEQALKEVVLYEGSMEAKESPRTVADDANWLWDIEEAERFVRLAITYPELLTYEEQETWKLLNASGLLKPARYRRRQTISWDWGVLEETVLPVLRGYWPQVMLAVRSPSEQQEWLERTRADVLNGKIYPTAANQIYDTPLPLRTTDV